MTDYTIAVRIDASPEEAETLVRASLADEGFGILTEIDVQQTLRTKLDVDMPPYRILGACNPPLAHRALQADPDIGAMLPCNVVVRAHPDGGSEVVAADPAAMLDVSGAPDLAPVAADAAAGIRRALAALTASS